MRAQTTAETAGAGLYVRFLSGEAHEVVDQAVERRPRFAAVVSRCTAHHSLTTPPSATIDLI